LTERNLTPSNIAFCATAPRVRRNFLATAGPESFAFASALKVFTSSFDHARTTRRFFLAITNPQRESTHCTDVRSLEQREFRAWFLFIFQSAGPSGVAAFLLRAIDIK